MSNLEQQQIFIISLSVCGSEIWEVRVLAGLWSSEGLTEAGGLGLSHSHGWEVHVGCWQDDSVFHHTNFSTGLLEYSHNMAASFPRVTDTRERQRKQGGL